MNEFQNMQKGKVQVGVQKSKVVVKFTFRDRENSGQEKFENGVN